MTHLGFYPPATEEEINEWEKENKLTIPGSYKEWLSFSDDTQILNGRACFWGLKMIDTCNEYVPKDYVVIGELVGDGEMLCFSKITDLIVSFDHGNLFEYGTFKEYLEFMLRTLRGKK